MDMYFLKVGAKYLLGRGYVPVTKEVVFARFSAKIAGSFFILALAAMPVSFVVGSIVAFGSLEIIALCWLDCRDAAFRDYPQQRRNTQDFRPGV